MTGKNDDKITDIVIPTLQKLQSGMTELQKDMGMVKEAIRRIDMRMGALEGHVSASIPHPAIIPTNWTISEAVSKL